MLVCPQCGLAQESGGYCPADGASLAPRGDDLLLGEKLGQFRVARLLGAGGMGRVYLAVHPDIGSRVAIKVLSRECADSRDLVERFFAEARAVNVIRHESIVNVIDLATLPDGRPYITMEYLDGAPLADVMKRRGPLPLGSLARLMGEVLDALGAAHAASIIHRDLKPDNIFVSPSGRAKVLDFGIAKLRPEASGRSGPTRTGSLLGTPHYMAPEQAMARPVDPRTDVYSIGVILYEGVTGRKPIEAESLYDLLRRQVEEMPAPPSTLRPELPPAYDNLIMRALAKEPESRFASAGDMAHALATATQALAPEAWQPIGGSAARARIGPASVPTPSGGPSPYEATGAAATPLPTPQAGEMHQPRPAEETQRRASGKGPILIGAGIAVAAIAAAVVMVVVMSGGGTEDDELAAGPVAAAGEREDESEGAGEREDEGAGEREDEGVGESEDEGAGESEDEGAGESEREGVAGALEQMEKDLEKNLGEMATVAEKTAADVERALAGTGPSGSAAKKAPAGQAPPSQQPPPARPRFAEFDVTGYIPTATRQARKIYDDAVLVRIDADGVYPNGKADLTLDDGFSVLYRFNSPSRSKRPDDLPMGVEHKPSCKIYVNVTAKGISVYPLEGWTCDEPLIGPPKCSARQVWRQGIQQGAPSKNAVGELGYWAGPGDEGRWLLDIGDAFSEWITDGC